MMRLNVLPGAGRSVLPLLVLLLAVAAAGFRTQPATYRVVVHAANPVQSLPKRQVSDLLLKRATRWPSGAPVQPVDQFESSPVRAAFTREVHGRSMGAIQSYWQQMIFSGRAVPPLERASDAEVLAYVRSQPGAIGYVSAAAPLGAGVRVLSVR